jgi:hypothetical protein
MKPTRGGKPKLTEKDIQRQIVDLLEAHGWQVLRTNQFFSGNAVVVQGASEPGIPDLQARRKYDSYVVHDLQRVIWIEVKRPGGVLSPDQVTWHMLAKLRGEAVIIAQSVEEVAAHVGISLMEEKRAA